MLVFLDQRVEAVEIRRHRFERATVVRQRFELVIVQVFDERTFGVEIMFGRFGGVDECKVLLFGVIERLGQFAFIVVLAAKE